MRLAVIALLGLAGCNLVGGESGDAIAASGSGSDRSFQVGNFDSVSLAAHHDVVVTTGSAPSVRAEGAPRDLDDLEIRVRGSELRIGLRDGTERRERSQVTVHVTVPALAAGTIGGSGNIRIDGVRGPSFRGTIGGSGDFDIESIEVEEARFTIGGSGNLRAGAGRARSTEIQIAGSGDVDLASIDSQTANVSVVGSGDVQIRASELASVRVVGSGDVTVAGQARCEVRKMGSGEVRCQQ